jgi:hypothetical protein
MFPQASARTRSVYGTTCWRRESCAYLQQIRGPGVLRECLLDPDVRVLKTVVVNCALELAPHDAELRDLVYYFSSDLLMVFYTCPSPFRLAKIYRATHSVFGSAGRLPAAYFFPGNL